MPWCCPYNWRELGNLNSNPLTYGRSTRDGCQFLFADGRVEFVANGVPQEVFNRMSGADLAGFKANALNIQTPTEFPCPLDAIWIHPKYGPDGLVVLWQDIHGNVISQEKLKGK